MTISDLVPDKHEDQGIMIIKKYELQGIMISKKYELLPKKTNPVAKAVEFKKKKNPCIEVDEKHPLHSSLNSFKVNGKKDISTEHQLHNTSDFP
jgi:hypothetical protein